MNTANIHQGQPVKYYGTNIRDASQTVILLHGRGATAESMIPIADNLSLEKTTCLIPQAAMNRWYPNTAFGPLEANEPDLSSALAWIEEIIEELNNQGFENHQIALGGFSQGACLAAEYVARNPRRYAGLFIFSGALIGPPGMKREINGSLDGTPVFIGGSDVDPWVAHDLMVETAAIFQRMDARVDFQTYPGMAHTVNMDELDRVRSMLKR